MHPGRPLNEVIQTVLTQQELKRDYLVPAADLSLFEDLTLGFGTTEIKPNNLLHEQLGSYLDIPKRFYDRLKENHPDLISLNVNRLLREKNGDRRLVRALGDTGRAILSDRYRMIDNVNVVADILQQVESSGSNLRVLSCEVTDSRLYLQLVSNLEGEIRVGDTVQSGVIFSNSEVGLGSVSVQAFLHRYACTNGMIIPEYSKRKNHLGARTDYIDADFFEVMTDEARQVSDKALFLQTRDYVNHLLSPEGFEKILNTVRAKADDPVHGDPEKVVEVISDKFALRAEESKNILYNFLKGNDSTRWGLANAVTALANDCPSYDRAVEMERLGGNLMTLDNKTFAGLTSVR